MTCLIGFAWSKALSVGVGLSAFESTGIYPFSRNKVPEYMFSSPDTDETLTATERAPPNMAPVCVISISVTTLLNVFPISAEPSLSTLNTVLHSDTSFEKITAYILFQINPIPKIPRKYLIKKKANLFFITEESSRQLQYFRSTRPENAEKEINKYSYS